MCNVSDAVTLGDTTRATFLDWVSVDKQPFAVDELCTS